MVRVFIGPMQFRQVNHYEKIRAVLTLPPKLKKMFQGFGDMGLEGIIKATGLSEQAAKGAAHRQYSEPGLFTGTEEQKDAFLKALATHNIKATQGGRFLTLSFGATKADQMMTITKHMQKRGFPAKPSLALGDAPNDIAMLETQILASLSQ